mmetsp:Transcript_26968/g.85787  ORF Transcript_26968/g.85787 Transcript_26968/m.85787 type:complete len:84 (+) Transcript_26968:956-1207(+)
MMCRLFNCFPSATIRPPEICGALATDRSSARCIPCWHEQLFHGAETRSVLQTAHDTQPRSSAMMLARIAAQPVKLANALPVAC